MSRYDAEPNYYYGRQPDAYDPEIGRAQGVARDGYAADDASAYTSRERRHKGPRYLEYGPDGSRYGQGGGAAYASRSHDDLRSRRDRDYSDSDEEEDDRQVARRKSRHGSRRSSRHRRGSIADDVEKPDDVGQTDWKKWGATIAGAAVGAYGVHRGMKGNNRGGGNEDYLGAAVGAVVGGLIAREAEKEWYKHKATKETNMVVSQDSGRRDKDR